METTNAERLAAGLPAWLPRGPETENAKLLEAVGDALDRIETDMREVRNATHPQTAGTIDQLSKLGAVVGESPRPGEQKEAYRVRVMASYQLLTSGGTLAEIISSISTLLDIPPSAIQVGETIEPGTVSFTVSGEAVQNIGVSTSDLDSLLNDQLAAGYRAEVLESGTLKYISKADYDAGNYDPTKGYDSLENGSPTGEGGTYGGIID
ncbi:baseplate protein [Halorubrum tailed virus 27]|uniref:P2 gpI-like phage tail protein n=1 Tax=Halorubrum tailed virus 27 TaxID=2878008 RepID=A0AAE8Y165_9CAUD|nr:baseplate protein [Halorubrum tailed virus 27]UBF22723.1 P2 gpI-like phage tail protein [Halorubrum tailed virus 27]